MSATRLALAYGETVLAVIAALMVPEWFWTTFGPLSESTLQSVPTNISIFWAWDPVKRDEPSGAISWWLVYARANLGIGMIVASNGSVSRSWNLSAPGRSGVKIRQTRGSELTRGMRILMGLSGGLFLLIGVPLFLSPSSMAQVFPWKVSPFVAMTVGAWCIGNAWLAGFTVHRATWRIVYSACIYLWLFAFIELGVVMAFHDKLIFSGLITWGYLAALTVLAGSGLVGVTEWLVRRPKMGLDGTAITRAQRSVIVAFVLFVGFLGIYGLLAPNGAPGTNGGIFPEPMSTFTLRSFGAFYLSLALGVLPLVFERSLPPLLHHATASYGLILTITLAAFANLRLFDFAARPGGLLYFGAYFAVGIPVAIGLLRLGTGANFAAGQRYDQSA